MTEPLATSLRDCGSVVNRPRATVARTDQATKGADSELPGWQPEEKTPATAARIQRNMRCSQISGAYERASQCSEGVFSSPASCTCNADDHFNGATIKIRARNPVTRGISSSMPASGGRGRCRRDERASPNRRSLHDVCKWRARATEAQELGRPLDRHAFVPFDGRGGVEPRTQRHNGELGHAFQVSWCRLKNGHRRTNGDALRGREAGAALRVTSERSVVSSERGKHPVRDWLSVFVRRAGRFRPAGQPRRVTCEVRTRVASRGI